MSLPLIEKAENDGITFVLSHQLRAAQELLYEISPAPMAPRIPQRFPVAGEQVQEVSEWKNLWW